MKKFLTTGLFVCLFVVLVACGDAESGGDGTGDSDNGDSKVTFNLSTPDPDSSSITVAAKEFAEVVSEKSGGTIQINVHANGTLYGADPSAGIRQLGEGSIDMLVLSTSLYANFKPEFSAISIPYLFDDSDQFFSFLNGEPGDKLIESISDLGIKGLGYWTRDFRQITNSRNPIYEPEDLRGLRLRVPNNPLWVEFFKGTGAVTTPMDFGEVYNAMQLGTIDGQENPVDVALATKFYEVNDYLTISNHMADGWIVGINDDKFNSLSSEQQQILLDATKELQSWKWDYDQGQFQTTVDTLVSEGMEVNELTPEQQQLFVEVSMEAYPKFKELIKNDEFFAEVLEFVGKSE
ncbi:tripartite ATP-independent transporter DctP family solute receptor [Evansella vedderi]|uniref:Tripartite ATP-independent transporter DctP family solute receptor n=1 Tax=Evansella vedderi TaxID=38282 RepID=A0ABT9ZSE6_9BACI|nr:DctP family TRAP transporter solute-binding subunit [Evansella vedderi]MDQ0254151.1 tripartite ATP-independent transporter DctP family solute receptor [Evansella vedderi]